MGDFIYVTNKYEEDGMELPTEPDNTLLLSTLQAQYPKAIGLKYKIDTRFRAVRLADGKLSPPVDGWEDRCYFCVFKDEDEGGSNLSGSSAKKATSNDGVQNTDLVVLGIPWSYTDGELKQYFEQFGPLEFANVKLDKNTGRSKGFGFIRYTSYESALKAMLKRHKIGNRICDVRIPESTKSGLEEAVSNKVFVGSLTQDITESDLKEYFEQYGVVKDALIPKPFREFAFVTFESDTIAKNLIGKTFKINDTTVKVTEATPKRMRNDNNKRGFDQMGNSFGRSGQYGGGNAGSGYGGGNQSFYNDQSSGYKKHRPDRDFSDWPGKPSTNGSNAVNSDVIQAVVSKAVSEVLNVQKALDPWGVRR